MTQREEQRLINAAIKRVDLRIVGYDQDRNVRTTNSLFMANRARKIKRLANRAHCQRWRDRNAAAYRRYMRLFMRKQRALKASVYQASKPIAVLTA